MDVDRVTGFHCGTMWLKTQTHALSHISSVIFDILFDLFLIHFLPGNACFAMLCNRFASNNARDSLVPRRTPLRISARPRSAKLPSAGWARGSVFWKKRYFTSTFNQMKNLEKEGIDKRKITHSGDTLNVDIHPSNRSLSWYDPQNVYFLRSQCNCLLEGGADFWTETRFRPKNRRPPQSK